MDHHFPLPDPPPPPPGSEPETEPQAEATSSKKPLVGALVVLAGLVAVVAAVGTWIAAPGRCDGTTFTSSRFAYCLTTPAGWQSGESNQGGFVYDTFSQADGSASVMVAADSLPQGGNLDALVTQIRSEMETQGLVLDEMTELSVDGVRGVQWDAQLEDPQGDTVTFRTVVVSQAGTFWYVRLQDSPEQFAGHASEFRAMLQSWRFI